MIACDYRGNSGHKSADGRDLPITAEGFGQRANLEMAWRTTRWAPAETPPTAAGGGEQQAAAAIEGRMPLRSTVSCSAALLSAPQHEVCAIGFDQKRGHCVTGDSDGLVRVWDVAKCVRAVRAGEQMEKECRLGLHRLYAHRRSSPGTLPGMLLIERLLVLTGITKATQCGGLRSTAGGCWPAAARRVTTARPDGSCCWT